MKNKLFYGDCLDVMKNKIEKESVDLIYLDPPFNSNRNYNIIYKDSTGRELPEQIEAFCDVWELNEERALEIQNMPILMNEGGIQEKDIQAWRYWMIALRENRPKLLAYLSYMATRLLMVRRVLKSTGSIYYHCDPTASHYIKILMDMIFGHENFRNEIVWSYQTGGISKRWFSKKHDILLFYSKTKDYCIHLERVKEKRTEKSLQRAKNPKGARFSFEDSTRFPIDVWDIQALNPMSKERLGYPTQKPLALLKRIILASSNENDVVLDPFCGCATTIAAAHELKRNWLGIDIAYHAVKKVIQGRLQDKHRLADGVHYEIGGIPSTKEYALDLWTREPYQFQRWAIESVDGFVTPKRTSDGGIDGILWFRFPGKKELSSMVIMVIEVKSGESVVIEVIRSLRGVLEGSRFEMAGLIIRNPLSDGKRQSFQREMSKAGFIEGYPRMQILILNDILQGKKFKTPDPEGRRDGLQGVFKVKDSLKQTTP